MWSGSALSGSLGTKGGVPYSGVGLELFGDSNNYFRYSTIPSELDVHTETFFLGNPATQYISGSNGLLEISSSGFYLTADGDVTASSFLAVNGSDVLFDSNSEFIDGINVGRVVYFNRDEFTYTGNLNTSPQTASIFETYILPGETRLQTSYMYEFTNNSGNISGSLVFTLFLQSASYTGTDGISTGYDSWSTPVAIASNVLITNINTATSGSIEGGAKNYSVSGINNYQGYYVRIFMTIRRNLNAGSILDALKVKGFVYRTSRSVGGSIGPAPGGPVS
jgi:hypothetical protein